MLLAQACEIDYDIAVPPGVRVSVEATGGDVEAADLRTDQPLELRSSAGDVGAERVVAPELRASSSAGDVGVVVPEGVYALAASAGAGDVRAGAIRTDPDSRRSLELRSSAGDVTAEVQTRR